MRLTENDIKLFYKLNPALLFYVNSELDILRGVSTVNELMDMPVEEKCKVRDQLYEHSELIDSFFNENPMKFSLDELKIIQSWKNFIKGTFYIFRYHKKYAIFLDTGSTSVAYGVLAINDSFENFFPHLPVMVKTVLLPFKKSIIYDGYIGAYSLYFGKGIRDSIKDEYNEAKAKFGIITSLPFDIETCKKDDGEKLKYYLKTEKNQDYYEDEIHELIHSSRKNMILYHQEMGKYHARSYGKKLREIGLNSGWFGILEGLIVGSGKTKEELEQNIKKVIPRNKKEYVYLFQLKAKE